MEPDERQAAAPSAPPSRRARLGTGVRWGGLGALYLIVVACLVLPQELRSESEVYVAVAWVCDMARLLAFQAGLVLAALGAVALWERRRRFALGLLPLVLLGVAPAVWSQRSKSPPPPRGSLVLMTWNLRLENTDATTVLGEIERVRPAVLVLQEYSPAWHAALAPLRGSTYPHGMTLDREDAFGLAVFSKLPLAEEGRVVRLGQAKVPALRLKLDRPEGPLVLYDVHLLPATFGQAQEHRRQVADLLEAVAAEQTPTMVVGDFNAGARGVLSALLGERGFRDAHDLAGAGRGSTWNAFVPLPGLRLDHVYLGPGLTAGSCRVGPPGGSDHLPVVAEVGFAPR